MKTPLRTFIIGLSLILLLTSHSTIARSAPNSASPASSTVLPARASEGALMIGWHEGGDDMAALKAHEQDLGKPFAIVRTYQQWNRPGRRVDELVADGLLVLVPTSRRHPNEAGGVRWPPDARTG